MNINITGYKIEEDLQYFRKQNEQPKKEVEKLVLFTLGVILGVVITLIVTSGGIH